MMNTLQAANLWLDSELILALRHVTIGLLEHDIHNYTYLKDIETQIEKTMVEAAKRNLTAAAQSALIKGKKIFNAYQISSSEQEHKVTEY